MKKYMIRSLTLILFIFFTASCGTEFDQEFCPSLTDCNAATVGVFNTFFTDDFNRADALIDDATWTTVNSGGSSVNILTNQVQPLSNNTFQPVAMHQVLVTASSFRITVEFEISGTDFNTNISTGNVGIFGLSQSTANFQSAYFCGMIGGTSNGRLLLTSSLGGVPQGTVTDTPSIPFSNGDSYTLTLTVDNGMLTCAISGSFTSSINLSDSNFSSGYSGFGGGNTAAAADGELLFDNFVLEIIN